MHIFYGSILSRNHHILKMDFMPNRMLTKKIPKLVLFFTGHTMTFNPTDQSLVIIGGYSETRGFNDVVLVQAKHGQGPLRAWHRWDFSAQTDFLK